jgi:hypothetical protein
VRVLADAASFRHGFRRVRSLKINQHREELFDT